MVTMRINTLLKQKGKSAYWLYKQLNMSYQSFQRLRNNETRSISRENIEALCQIFDCTPNDLFEFAQEKAPTGSN